MSTENIKKMISDKKYSIKLFSFKNQYEFYKYCLKIKRNIKFILLNKKEIINKAKNILEIQNSFKKAKKFISKALAVSLAILSLNCVIQNFVNAKAIKQEYFNKNKKKSKIWSFVKLFSGAVGVYFTGVQIYNFIYFIYKYEKEETKRLGFWPVGLPENLKYLKSLLDLLPKDQVRNLTFGDLRQLSSSLSQLKSLTSIFLSFGTVGKNEGVIFINLDMMLNKLSEGELKKLIINELKKRDSDAEHCGGFAIAHIKGLKSKIIDGSKSMLMDLLAKKSIKELKELFGSILTTVSGNSMPALVNLFTNNLIEFHIYSKQYDFLSRALNEALASALNLPIELEIQLGSDRLKCIYGILKEKQKNEILNALLLQQTNGNSTKLSRELIEFFNKNESP
ncbi:MAG: hypothetical protein LBJ32_03475 [Oscillospiraceae bacterium]|jgi:hypothetical protein|nr:hypothetical protein [Oscillospiraceae bacterium]